MSELSERKEAARLVRCTCPRNFKFHAENCPIQPGEHQEDWARNADAENQALREDKDELYAEREEDARRIEALQQRAETLESHRGALVRRLRFFVQEYERIESQNQALQEERDTYRDMWLTDHKAFEDERAISLALQEENDRLGKMLSELNDAQVVQEKALLAIRDSKDAVPPVDASECRAIARNALSPTQETDPG